MNTYLGGWTAGGGGAVALAQNWNVFAEYRYTDYGSLTAALPFSQLSTAMTTKTSAVDVGVNYKFNWGAGAGPYVEPIYKAPSYGDKVARLTKAPAISSAFTWTGLFVGGDGGYGWHFGNGMLTNAAGTPLAPYDENANGPLSGVFAGGNYQLGEFVAGVEGDWQWSRLIGNNQELAPLGAAGDFPRRPLHDLDDNQGLRIGARTFRFCVRSTFGLRHRRVGMGRPVGRLRRAGLDAVRRQWR